MDIKVCDICGTKINGDIYKISYTPETELYCDFKTINSAEWDACESCYYKIFTAAQEKKEEIKLEENHD